MNVCTSRNLISTYTLFADAKMSDKEDDDDGIEDIAAQDNDDNDDDNNDDSMLQCKHI